MRVSRTVDVPSSNHHPPKVSGYVIDGLSGTRSDDFRGEQLELEEAMTEQGMGVEMPEGALFVVAVKRTKRPYV